MGQILLEHELAVRLVEAKLAQRFRALLAEEIADLRHLEVPLRAQKDMDAVAKGRALPHEEAALPQHFFEMAGLGRGGMRLGDEVATMKDGQPTGVKVASLRSPAGQPVAGFLPSVGCRS